MSLLPKSLEQVNKEFISIDGKPFQIVVELVPFSMVEESTSAELQFKLSKDLIAKAALINMGIPKEDHVEMYTNCRYGGFDDAPDIDQDGVETPEYFNCSKRGNCIGEGKVCKHIKAQNGTLTPKEIEVIKLIVQDLADKQIADKLNITYNTATTHRQNIQNKIGCHSKVGIATFAQRKNII